MTDAFSRSTLGSELIGAAPLLILSLQCIVWDNRFIEVRKSHYFQHVSLYPIWASFLLGYRFTGFTRYISFMIFYSFYDDNYRCTESDFLWAFNMMNLFLRLTRSDTSIISLCLRILLSISMKVAYLMCLCQIAGYRFGGWSMLDFENMRFYQIVYSPATWSVGIVRLLQAVMLIIPVATYTI